MTDIHNKMVVAKALQSGIRSLAEKEKKKVTVAEEEIAAQLQVGVRTLRGWKTPTEIPNTIATMDFRALLWLLITRGELGLDWFVRVLEGIDTPIYPPITRDVLTRYFEGVTHDHDEFEATIERLLGSVTTDNPNLEGQDTETATFGKSFLPLLSFALLFSSMIGGIVTFVILQNTQKEQTVCSQPIKRAEPKFIPDQGFSLFEVANNTPESSILTNEIRTVATGPTGLWVGYGARPQSVNAISVYQRDNAPEPRWIHCRGLNLAPGQNVNDFAFHNATVLVATDGAGVGVLENDQWQFFTTDHGLPSNSVYDLWVEDEEHLWAATFEGVAKLIGQRWETVYRAEADKLVSSHVYSFLEDETGTRWFGLIDNGITRLASDGNWDSFYTNEPGLKQVRGIETDQRGGVWFATDGGGVVYFRDDVWTIYNVANSTLPSDNVLDIARDKYDRIWVATQHGLAYTPDYGDTWVTHSTADIGSITFGCLQCLDPEFQMWLVVRGQGIANVRIPPPQPTIRIVSTPDPVRLKPGQEYSFEVEVEVLTEALTETDGDALLSNDPLGTPLYKTYSIVPYRGVGVEPGQYYTFSNVEDPIIAPDIPGVYELSWRVWQGSRFVSEPITIQFEVIEE